MQWICNITLFLVLSGILLEMISDTKYVKFARWVVGTILLLQLFKPFAEAEKLWTRFVTVFSSFDYALDNRRVPEELYGVEEQREGAVLADYKERLKKQIDGILQKHGLQLLYADFEIQENGLISKMKLKAVYSDREEVAEIAIPTVSPVNLWNREEDNMVSPLELYIRELLAELYQMEENKIEVVIQEAD